MIDKAIDAATKVGKLQLQYLDKFYKIKEKDEHELVCEIDFKSQEIIENILIQESDYPIISEEKENQNNNDNFWVVDPLDGTHNFIKKLPNFGVSIALILNKKFQAGVIYLPFFDKIIFAQKNKGAFCNDKIIKVSNIQRLKNSMINYDNQFYLHQKAFYNYQKIVKKSFTTRISGSAVYDINLIACGNIEARIWNKSKIYDFAAGAVIIKEAGGKITDFQGQELSVNSTDIIASNSHIHTQLLEILNK